MAGTALHTVRPPAAAEPADSVPGGIGAARRIGWVLLGCQLGAMMVLSTVQYRRGALTHDFGGYAQAWWAIAHGDLNPFSTLFGTDFWRNNAEFGLWPLAGLYHLSPSPLDLLWVQDIAVVATEVVALGWLADILSVTAGKPGKSAPPGKPGPDIRAGVLVACAVLMVANPWAWETVVFDVHFPPFAALFLVLAGRDLWSGRTHRLWAWVPLLLVTDALGGLYLLGLGASGVMAGPRTRRVGVLLGCVGSAYLVAITAAGGTGVGGHTLTHSYGYLVGAHHGPVGITDIAAGALAHPATALHTAASRWAVAVDFLLPVGVVGLFSPWGLGVGLAVFGPPMLAGDLTFFRPVAAFQVWPAMPFLLVGSVMVVLRLASLAGHGPDRRWVRLLGVSLAIVWVTVTVGRSVTAFGIVPATALAVNAATGHELGRLADEIPRSAEVIASEGVVGRLAERPLAYHVGTADHRFPVRSRLVYFVFTPGQGLGQLPPGESRADVAFVQHTLGGRVVDRRAGVVAIAWRPLPAVRQVRLP